MSAKPASSAPDIDLAAAIVMHRDHVLIVRRSMTEKFLPGVWSLPCGKVDAGENPRDAVLRELREETGLDGTVIRFAGTSPPFQSNFRGTAVRNLQRNYVVQLRGPAARAQAWPKVELPDEETQDFRWVPVDEIDKAELDDHNRRAIRQGLPSRQQAQQVSGSARR
jgi:8-oxo-dGTP pyrophosphatase MutT (NUDIX family)